MKVLSAFRSSGSDRSVAHSVTVLLGVAACVALWLVLVPWDLSEYDADGKVIPGGGDDSFGRIGIVYGIVFAAGLGYVVYRPPPLRVAGTAALVTWAVLFAWRTSTARVSGANLWVLSFAIFVVPAGLLAWAVLRDVERRLTARRELRALPPPRGDPL